MTEVSIIVPALNEAENLPALVERIGAALSGRPYEIIVVDDNSRDDTRGVCAKLSLRFPLNLIVRERPRHGLSGAVICGMERARGQYLVVLDADLQHPPEQIPSLLEPLRRGDADFTLGSRYVEGGTMEMGWTVFRRLNSWVATALARPFSARVSDPMSGFFALPRASFLTAAPTLSPLGYKIALELMCKCRVRRVREVPIHFGLRRHGQSKLTVGQQFRYLEHLSRLYDFFFPRSSQVVKFLIVIAASWTPALLAGWLMLSRSTPPIVAAVLTGGIAIAMTSLFHLRYVRTQREFLTRPHPWFDFAVISMAELAIGTLATIWIIARIGDVGIGEVLLLQALVCIATRYLLRRELLQDLRGLGPMRRLEEPSVQPTA